MNIVVAPDKFKGSLSSFEVCHSIESGIRKSITGAVIHCFPMADGGDGFSSVLNHYLQTETISCATKDPLQRNIVAFYQWDPAGKTAIIEMASASGLVLLKQEECNPMLTSTYGTGLMIKDAIDKGAQKIVLGLGGSATNDAGTGILAALGFVFLSINNIPLVPNGGTLSLIDKIILPPELPVVKFEIACDVNNPLYGEIGAAFIYAPQKGANDSDVILLDEGLKKFNAVASSQTGKDVSLVPGTGAAGGIAAGLMYYFDASISRGIDLVISASNIENALPGADLIITGEGKLDAQTGQGKVIGCIAALANKYKLPVIALCGSVQLPGEEIKKLGLNNAYSIGNETTPLEFAMSNAAVLLEEKTASVISFFSPIFPGR